MRELAAGVVVAGFDGTDIDAPELTDVFSRVERLAGFVLFARNIVTLEQTRVLTDAIRVRYAGREMPILAIDQEGGRVVRLHDGVERIPAAAELGELGDVDACRLVGERVAFDLRRAGFTVNFAPVLDLAIEPGNSVIGSRSFGSDPERVIACAGAFARGLRDGGIVPVFKHFPGHGSTVVDSHFDLPVVDVDEAVFRGRDLVPFVRLLSENAGEAGVAVMSGHVVVKAFDDENPATLSHRVLTDVLRGEIGFGGVCFTDCLQMDAVAKTVGTAGAAVRAIGAGADCVVISRGPDVAYECVAAIEQAVADGDLSRSRLQEAHDRVCRLRGS
jgi:beta-N-acetylhexosaminidase